MDTDKTVSEVETLPVRFVGKPTKQGRIVCKKEADEALLDIRTNTKILAIHLERDFEEA